MTNIMTATLICIGVAPTAPRTEIEVEVKPPDKYSTMRFEVVEGSLAGTAYIQSIGSLKRSRNGNVMEFRTDYGPNATILKVKVRGKEVTEGRYSNYVTGMNQSPVECTVSSDSRNRAAEQDGHTDDGKSIPNDHEGH